MHYFCDKLTEEDIKRLQTDPGIIYRCKQFSSSDDNTLLKTVATTSADKTECVPSCATKTVLELPCIPNNAFGEPKGRSAAEAILEEETTDTCHVCEMQLAGNINRCDFCASPCHDGCMAHAADMEEVCLSCAATQAQISHGEQTLSQGTGTQDVSPEINQQYDSQTNSTQTVCTGNNQSEHEPQEPHTAQGENEPHRGVQVQDTSQLSQEPNLTRQLPAKVTKPREKRHTAESLSVKQRELRQLEIKLKKWEGLKTQEARMADMTTSTRKLENYLERTEARNVELERTV